MNSKKLFVHFMLASLALLIASSALVSLRYNLPYPAKLGPEFDVVLKYDDMVAIENTHPEIVMIGDSVLEEGVDEKQLSEELGVTVHRSPIPGSGTAAWYLFMKNIVYGADYHPKYVVVLFRHTILTVPEYRTGGKYFYLLDDYARKEEPLVAEIVFINQMTPFEKFAEQYIPAYTARVDIREDLDNALRYKIPALAGCDRDCTDQAVGSLFGREVDPIALNLAQEDAAKVLYDPKEFDFDRQIDTSLLPHMIRLAQQNGSTLIFVRTKIFGPEPAELKQYTQKLDEYLAQQEGVILLDYENDPRILESFYVDSLHNNPYGKHEFTSILAEDFKTIITR